MRRYKNQNMLQVAVIPFGHTKDIDSFLQPLLEELKVLEQFGMTVVCSRQVFQLKAHLLLVTGDIMGMQELAHHTGHASRFGCRQCHIVSVPCVGPSGDGQDQYYPGSEHLDIARSEDEFRLGNSVSCYSLSSNMFLLNRLSILRLLA